MKVSFGPFGGRWWHLHILYSECTVILSFSCFRKQSRMQLLFSWFVLECDAVNWLHLSLYSVERRLNEMFISCDEVDVYHLYLQTLSLFWFILFFSWNITNDGLCDKKKLKWGHYFGESPCVMKCDWFAWNFNKCLYHFYTCLQLTWSTFLLLPVAFYAS